jgi:hypothetical protein
MLQIWTAGLLPDQAFQKMVRRFYGEFVHFRRLFSSWRRGVAA